MLEPNDVFHIINHQIQASHLRTYRRSALDENTAFKLDVKQYIPRDNTGSADSGVTFVAAPGIGFPKECYEPLFAEMFARFRAENIQVRGFWIADSAPMGQSGLQNVSNLGTEVSWWDHSRDLLNMINVFQTQMPRPLIGLGHSMGGAQIAYLSTLHPSLFTALILIEPPIYEFIERSGPVAQARRMIRRRDTWRDLTEAERAIRKSPYYASWDPRVLDRYIAFGFHKDDSKDGVQAVRLVANKYLELAQIYRVNYDGIGLNGPDAITIDDRIDHPDLDGTQTEPAPLYFPNTRQMFFLLPLLRPRVLYIEGTHSSSSSPDDARRSRLETTGIGPGGSGGSRLGAVSQFQIEGGQHTMPLDGSLVEVAQAASHFGVDAVRRWRKVEEMPRWSADQLTTRPPKSDPRLLWTIESFEEEKKRVYDKAKL